ncbi:MAG: hypothetical protein PHF76_10095 [Bacteroidales bacterium]|nr:hypothetical protein [Bacteroidales bacterium]
MGFSEKAYDGVAGYLEPSIKEEADIETAIAGVEGLLKVFQGEADSIRTAKSTAEKRLAELEAKVKELGGAPPNKEEGKKNPDDTTGDTTPAWAKAIIDSNKSLSEKIAALEGEKTTTSRKQQLDTIIAQLPEALRKPYSRMPVKDLSNEEFDLLMKDTSEEVDSLVTEIGAKGAVFGKPKTGNNITRQSEKQATKEETDAVVTMFNL